MVLAIVVLALMPRGPDSSEFFATESGVAVLIGFGVLVVAGVLVHIGRLHLGLGLYVGMTASVAYAPCFVPSTDAQMGMLSSLVFPVMVAATAWRARTAVWVLVGLTALGLVLVANSQLSEDLRKIAWAELAVVGVGGGLAVVLRRHFERREARHAELAAERTRQVVAVRDRYRSLFEVVGDAVMVADQQGKFLEINEGACKQLGYTRGELLAMRIQDIIPKSDQGLGQMMGRVMMEGSAIFETVHVAKDGRELPMELSIVKIDYAGAVAFMAVGRDISERRQAEGERRRLELQLLHAMKMESIGRLASGVAHDLNNVLTAIGGNLELARDAVRDRAALDLLENVQIAADSAASLTRQLLGFSKKQVIAPRDFNPGELATRLSRLLDRLIAKEVRLSIAVAPDVGTVHADPGLIEQVIVNLAVNARDAMPTGGEIHIAVDNVELDGTSTTGHAELAAGAYVRITVSDTGTGIAPEVLPHIFEPFFTTKSAERGTGLGLATSYGAIKQSGGAIGVYSELGRGTTFKIYLPRVDKVAVSLSTRETVRPVVGRGETVLVVEDDGPCRMLAQHVLNNLGYRVIAARDGNEAIELAQTHAGSIDLLMTDMIMPGMSGNEVADALQRARPGLKVVYTSGYPENIIASRVGSQLYLGKPYSIGSLAAKLREALEQPHSSAASSPRELVTARSPGRHDG